MYEFIIVFQLNPLSKEYSNLTSPINWLLHSILYLLFVCQFELTIGFVNDKFPIVNLFKDVANIAGSDALTILIKLFDPLTFEGIDQV